MAQEEEKTHVEKITLEKTSRIETGSFGVASNWLQEHAKDRLRKNDTEGAEVVRVNVKFSDGSELNRSYTLLPHGRETAEMTTAVDLEKYLVDQLTEEMDNHGSEVKKGVAQKQLRALGAPLPR